MSLSFIETRAWILNCPQEAFEAGRPLLAEPLLTLFSRNIALLHIADLSS